MLVPIHPWKKCYAVISREPCQASRVPLPPAGGRFFLSVVIYVVRAKTRKIKSKEK